MFGDRPYTASLKYSTDTSSVYQIGRYEVSVQLGAEDPEKAVTYRPPTGYSKERGPDIEIRDGQIIVDLHDLLEMALDRCSPEELAQGLWSKSEEVRSAFCDVFVGHEFGEGDRDWDHLRERTLQQANRNLLARRLNGVARALRAANYYERKYWELYHAHDSAGRNERPDFLPPIRWQKNDYTGLPERVWVQEDPEHKIGSKNWREAEAYWREKLTEFFQLEPLLSGVEPA